MTHQIPCPVLPPVSIVILAGGRATRMHGIDKGLQEINGQPLVQHLLEQFDGQTDDILINTNRSLQHYHQQFSEARIISDDWPDFRGPLAGIHSGLKYAKHDYLLVVPCDQFAIPENVIAQLLNTLLQQSLDVVYITLNEQAIYPFCLLHKRLLVSLEKHINNQQYAVRQWLFTQRATTVNFTIDPDIPINLNTPEQLQQAACYDQHMLTITTQAMDYNHVIITKLAGDI